MKKYLIITTVGTSLFTNYAKEEVRDSFDNYEPIDFKDWEKKKLTAKDYSRPGNDFSNMEDILKNQWLSGKKRVGQYWILDEKETNRQASAEITSILEIAGKIKKESNEDVEIEVQLLATDTALSVSAARLISLFPFDQQGLGIKLLEFKAEKDFIPSLGVHPIEGQDKGEYYDDGLQSLVERLIGKEGLIKKAKNNKKHEIKPVINFSGGYKAIIPLLTIIAQLEDVPMYYIYEESDYLMEIGSLPVNFDWGIIEMYHSYLDDALLLNPTQYGSSGFNETIASFLLQNKLIYQSNNAYGLTSMGKVVKNYLEKATSSKPSIFGEYIETKLLEFYTDCFRLNIDLPREDGEISELPLRSVKFEKGKDKGDYDLFLVKTSNQELTCIACEIKSISSIRENQKEKLKDQFRKYSVCFYTTPEFKGKILKEIRLYIHKLPFQTQFLDEAKGILTEFKAYVENDLGKKFSVFMVDVKVKGYKIDYHGFLKEKLVSNSIAKYMFNSVDLA